MTEPEFRELADRYFVMWKETFDPTHQTGLPVADVDERLQDWILDAEFERPEDLWRFILAALERDREGEVLHVLSAGELENILVYHGPAFIDRVENEARTNPRFATLLGGGWNRDMKPEVWARVVAARDRHGWDGEDAPADHWWKPPAVPDVEARQ